MFLPELPKVFAAGATKAVGSNHWLIVGFDKVPLPIRFGNNAKPQKHEPDRAPLVSLPTVGVNGTPERAEKMLERRQPPATWFTIPWTGNIRPSPTGIS